MPSFSFPLLFRALFWLSCTLVLVLSLSPVEYLSASVFNWWDKAQHALGFSLLSGLGLMAYPILVWRVVTGLLAYGIAIEIMQEASGWRHGDFADFLADAVGVMLGSLVAWTARRHS